MSGNPYRRHGQPPAQGGQQGLGNSGYYGRSNSQYHHNNHSHGHGYGRGGRGSHRGRGYSRNHYGGHSNYSGSYGSRNNAYHQSQYNNGNPAIGPSNTGPPGSRYGHHSQYPPASGWSESGGHESTTQSQPQTYSYSQSPIQTPSVASSHSYQPTTKDAPREQRTITAKEPTVLANPAPSAITAAIGSKLFSSRRGIDEKRKPSVPATAQVISAPVTTSVKSEEIKETSNEIIKKPLDIKTLQPMKRRKSVARPPITEDSALAKEESRERTGKIPVKANTLAAQDPPILDGSDTHITKEETDVPAKEDQPVESSLDRPKADDEDEDEPISLKKSSDVATHEAKIIESEEDDTDVEDTIPVPSRKTRRLHRLLVDQPNSDDDKIDDSNPSNKVKSKPLKKSRGSTSSNTDSSRSQSPKLRKSSRTGRDASGRTLLQRMCAKGNYEEAKRLIEAGSNVNDADFAGVTPLHEAALEGYYEIAELLLDNGANINVQSGQMDKDTPIIDATSNLHYDVVKLLLDRGADPTLVNTQDEDSMDVLKSAMDDILEDNENEDYDEMIKNARRIKKLLSQRYKEINSGKTSKKGKSDPSKNSRRERTSSADADIYPSLRVGGLDSLHDRIRGNDVTFVLNYVSSTNGNKIPPEALLLASKLGFPDIASLLIAFGADINFRDKHGWTPLMHAVGKGHIEMVKLLVSNQADISLKDKKGRTVLDLLEENGESDSEEYSMLYEKFQELGLSTKKSIAKIDGSDEDAGDAEGLMEVEKGELIEKKEPARKVDPNENTPSSSVEHKNHKSVVKDDYNEDKNEGGDDDDDDNDDNDDDEIILPSKKHRLPSLEVGADAESNGKSTDGHRQFKKPKSESGSGAKDTVLVPPPHHSSEKVTEMKEPVAEPSTEEIEARKLKEIEAQKAREAFEHQRNERKRLKQQEIAKRIDAFERQREDEKRALEREALDKKLKEEEEQMKILMEQERAKRKEEIKIEVEKRRLIRSYYPYGLRQIDFNGSLDKTRISQYLPLYVFKFDNEEYLIDIQLSILLSTESLYVKYPQLTKIPVKAELRAGLWNFLWPIIGSFNDTRLEDFDTMNKQYEIEGENFKALVTNWVKVSEFEELVKIQEELQPLREEILKTDGTLKVCRAALSTMPVGILAANKEEASKSDTINLTVSTPDNTHPRLPLRFGNSARTALKLVHQSLW